MDFKVGDIVRRKFPNGYEMCITEINTPHSILIGIVTKSGDYSHHRTYSIGERAGTQSINFELVSHETGTFDAKALADEFRANIVRNREIRVLMGAEGFVGYYDEQRMSPAAANPRTATFRKTVEEKV